MRKTLLQLLTYDINIASSLDIYTHICRLDVQIVAVYRQNVKRVDRLMNVQIVLGSNVAAGILLAINLV